MEDAQYRRVAKALADPNRCEILELVAHNDTPMCCGAVVGKMPLTQATVSHHLKELVEAGLLTMREERQYNLYTVNRDILLAYTRELHRRIGAETPNPVA